MKKLQRSIAAKLIAWILISISGSAVFFGVAAAFIFEEEGIYRMSKEQKQEEAFASLSDRYSAMALWRMTRGEDNDAYEDNEAYFSDKNFKYGIIEASSLEELKKKNLNADATYIERNFSEKVSLDELHLFYCTIKSDTYFTMKYPERLFGYFYISNCFPSGKKGETTYYVVSYVPETLSGMEDAESGDLYVQCGSLINRAYYIRYGIFWIIAVGMVFFLVSLVFLVMAAGHHSDKEEITATWVEKIPLDILTIGVLLLEIALFYLAVMFASTVEDIHSIFWITATVFALLCAAWLLLGFFLDFVVRVKLGKWWRNTIVYLVCHGVCKAVRRFCQRVGENTTLFWKLILIFSGLCFLEFIIIVLCYGAYGVMPLFLWMIKEILIFLVLFKAVGEMSRLKEAGEHIAAGELQYQVDTEKMYADFKKHGDNLNSIRSGLSKAVNERMKSEHFKTELITNVSHDIKTPLTSIINYVDLLGKEEIENEQAKEYIEVLKRQSSRLKKLIEDLIEASKASTGNLTVNFEKLEAGVFMVQTVGEFEEKTKASGLELLIKKPEEPVYIMADGRHFWRVIDNLMNNICKYAQEGTRVYINLEVREKKAYIIFRNTSRYPLNISSEELMERFVRGDSSRNTEGNGLGLSIARSLMELMNGTFELHVDGDLFKVTLTFDVVS